uniref:Uncharacterized protein n=1 Tax=viral metagenome TaxID=1070528 RepID=A0A6C0I1Z9_9ZZZZ
MANQYCKITSWIEHNKKHGDSEYAKAISDLCLESYFNPSKYNGLTFLYQTNKTIKEKFIDAKFKSAARTLCNEFKRHILPDVFLSCEDFNTKDVGNILGEKYIVKSCTKDTVTFTNGMEIHALENNSFEPLSENLKDIIRIYYIVKGDPNKEVNGSYNITHRKKPNKHSLNIIEGGAATLRHMMKMGAQESDIKRQKAKIARYIITKKRSGKNSVNREIRKHSNSRIKRGGTAEEFLHVYDLSKLKEHIVTLSIENIRRNGPTALNVGLYMLIKKLKSLKAANNSPAGIPQDSSSSSSSASANSSSSDSSSSMFEDNMTQSPSEQLPSEKSSEQAEVVLGGNTEFCKNLKNLILAQWLINSCLEGVIPYIYLCLYILYKSEIADDDFKLFINDLIINMLKTIDGSTISISIDGMGQDYIANLTLISRTEFEFDRSSITQTTYYKICEFITKLKQSEIEIQQNLIGQFYNRIANYSNIWNGNFIPTFDGSIADSIVSCGTFLSLWTLTLFSFSMDETDIPSKLEMLDNTFFKLINENTMDFNTEYIFDKETLTKFIAGPASHIINTDIEVAIGEATGTDNGAIIDNSETQQVSIGIFD